LGIGTLCMSLRGRKSIKSIDISINRHRSQVILIVGVLFNEPLRSLLTVSRTTVKGDLNRLISYFSHSCGKCRIREGA